MTHETLVCVAPVGDRCGEGAVWHDGHRAVYWTDINRFLIHRYDPASKSVVSWLFDEPVVALALTSDDDLLLVALASRLIFWRPASDGRCDQGFKLPGWPAVRLNDGRVDPQGRFWIGSMRNNVAADGQGLPAGGADGVLYRIDPDGTVTEWRRDIGITNTLCWTPDQHHFLTADTLANEIVRYDFDAASGAITNPQPFLTGFDRGVPDGSAMDCDGVLWNCRYFGGGIVRVARDGTVLDLVSLPVRNVTTCIFGGDDLKTLYITTAANEADPADRLAGSLFALPVAVPGLPPTRFQLAG